MDDDTGATPEQLAVVLSLGRRDPTLADLQADFRAYRITHEYQPSRGFVFVAKRVAGHEGPFLVMTDDASEMREILGGSYREIQRKPLGG